MKRIGILGDIGSGKSYVAKNFGYPVFNADEEVGKLYRKDRKIFNKFKKILPKYIKSFPINKKEIISAILSNKNNLKIIIKIVHHEIRKKMNIFVNKNKNKKIVILDIPLLLENRINKKSDILVFVQANKIEIKKRLKKRSNYNFKLLNKFKKIQLSVDYKKKKSKFIVKNNLRNKSFKKDIKRIIREIL